MPKVEVETNLSRVDEDLDKPPSCFVNKYSGLL